MREIVRIAIYGLILVAISALLISGLVGVLTISDPLKTTVYTLLLAIIGLVIAVIVVLPFLFAAPRRGNIECNREAEIPTTLITPGETEIPADQEKVSRPWDLIPENDREIIRLWQEGYTAKEIAHRLRFKKHTVENRISALRKQYGEEVVPLRRKRREILRNN